eukprot:gnl/TRDRNA2_/TRDRNA2_85607_c1_seq1.p1 gnl/TRDRNA2_/TRDRNA2_85607_c1~~gnl/TRDRNA2_/TRDRNA2_85607_c1_seq1.p1  ORF type:complete len:561 (+),score=120.88 gnl/TRDRNA2_/TRDRNA2_85607_c1_seq1:247-1683(+)
MAPEGQEWAAFEEKTDGCNKGGSLCFLEDGLFTCAPPTVQLTSRWDDLDLNGDGIWTFEEAEEVAEKIHCQLKVNVLEVFQVFVRFLENRKKIIWLHPDVLAGKAIHLPYFKYAAGDIQVCHFKTTDMCANLLKRGFFDAALTHSTVPRVGNTTQSAMKYCHALLADGGFCEATLPSTYSVWKKKAVEECKKPYFFPFVYTHPVTGDPKSMLSVDYEARRDYEMAQGPFFIMYKSFVVALWILSMVYEAKGLILIFNFLIVYPSSQDGSDAVEEYENDGSVKYKINKMQGGQRAMITFLTVCRLAMLAVLSVVGTSLLLKQISYMGLVMDAVSLVFVLDIATILYSQAVRPKAQSEIADNVDPMQVRLLAPDMLRKNPALQDVLWLVVVVVIVAVIMTHYQIATVLPLYDALECTCVVKGESCREARLFDYDYWYEYWHKGTPQIFRDVAKLKAEASLIQQSTFGKQLLKAAKSIKQS